eukprot:5660243-Amphidinium_carterae.1
MKLDASNGALLRSDVCQLCRYVAPDLLNDKNACGPCGSSRNSYFHQLPRQCRLGCQGLTWMSCGLTCKDAYCVEPNTLLQATALLSSEALNSSRVLLVDMTQQFNGLMTNDAFIHCRTDDHLAHLARKHSSFSLNAILDQSKLHNGSFMNTMDRIITSHCDRTPQPPQPTTLLTRRGMMIACHLLHNGGAAKLPLPQDWIIIDAFPTCPSSRR